MLCLKCSPATDIPDGQYVEHVNVVHSGKPQAKMIPLDPNLPPDTDPAFAETWAEIQKFEAEEKAKKAQQPPLPMPQPTPVQPTERKPVELTYKYIGQAEDGHSVETLELDVDGKHFVIAFDPVEKTQVESKEVANLQARIISSTPISFQSVPEIETPDIIAEPEKPKKKTKIEPLNT